MKNFKKLIKEAHLGNPLNEATDFNDPALMKARAAQMKRDKMDKEEAEYKAKQAALDKKYGSNFMDKLDAELDLKQELADLEDEREDVLRNMEEEAEPEGGPIADDYGSILNDMDARMAAIKSELEDLRIYESVNEDRFKKNEDSYIRVTEPRFNKDSVNPNFLFVRINYDTGPGVGTALGKETMAGQIRRLSSAEAVRQLEDIGRKLSDNYDLEDLEIVDLENGVAELFAVSDDFVDMDVKSELSTAMLEGTCGYGKNGKIGKKPAGPDLIDEGSVEDELERLGIKYELSGNKYKPFKKIFKPINKSDKFYKEFNDVVWRYNLSSAVESINEGFVEGELEKRNEALYDVLVPGSGKTGTVEGEMLRAINKIVYRWWNDGDKFYEGYGAETAGPSHSYLINSSNPLNNTLASIFDKAVTSSNQGDGVYERILELALTKVLDYIESKEGNYTKSEVDMYDYDSEFEDETQDDSWDEEDDYYSVDDYDGEDEEDQYDHMEESINEAGVDISLGIGVMDEIKRLYKNKDIQGLKDFRQRFDYPKASMKVKKLVPKLIDDLENKESVNEDIQPLAVEELTDEALTRLRDQFLTTGTRPNEAEMALLKSVLDEMNKRGLEESVNEGMSPEEWEAAKEAERLENHPESEKIRDIQKMFDNEKKLKEFGSSEIDEKTILMFMDYLGPLIFDMEEEVKLNSARDMISRNNLNISPEKLLDATERYAFMEDENLMEDEEELTSLTPNEIGDEERADSFNENKKFNFKSMIKEALTPNYLK